MSYPRDIQDGSRQACRQNQAKHRNTLSLKFGPFCTTERRSSVG
jgi:hypothetical protein